MSLLIDTRIMILDIVSYVKRSEYNIKITILSSPFYTNFKITFKLAHLLVRGSQQDGAVCEFIDSWQAVG
ncbi:hypothetical protein ES703_32070 [subsurface metagenome]